MKKFLSIILSIAILFCIATINVFAIDGPEDESDEDEVEWKYFDYDAVEYMDLPNYINPEQKPDFLNTRNNMMLSGAYVVESAWTTSGIQRYYQDDYTNPICSGGSSIAQVGCFFTSAAMVLAKYNVYKNPEQVFYDFRDFGVASADCNMNWSILATTTTYPGINTERWLNTPGYLEANGKETIRNVLKTGKPIIVEVYKPGAVRPSHFVVCYGYEKYSNGQYYHYTFNPQRNKPETIEGYMADRYIRSFVTFYR